MPIGKASALMLVILRLASGKPNHSVPEELLRKHKKMLTQEKDILVCLALYPPVERRRLVSRNDLLSNR
jgi:hypothetical protein